LPAKTPDQSPQAERYSLRSRKRQQLPCDGASLHERLHKSAAFQPLRQKS
jgi:hypothetical protein